MPGELILRAAQAARGPARSAARRTAANAHLAVLAALLCAFACAPRRAAVPLEERLARDTWGLPARVVHAPDGSFSTEILGELARPMRPLPDGSGTSLDVDVGSARPVECIVLEEDVDLAGTLRALSLRAMDETAGERGAILSRRVRDLDVGSFGVAPMLGVEWVFRTRAGASHHKHRIASRFGRAVYCRHLDAGYSGGFARMFERMVRSFRTPGAASAEPFYTSVALSRVGGLPVAIERTSFADDGGAVRSRWRSSRLVAVGGTALLATDTMRAGFATRDGALINAVYARSDNGRLVTKLAIDPIDGGWLVAGTLDGGRFTASLQEVPLSSRLGASLALRALIRDRGPGASQELPVWAPSVRPGEPATLRHEVRRARDDGHFDVTSTVGSVTQRAVVDVTGQARSARLVAGGPLTEVEELYRAGRF